MTDVIEAALAGAMAALDVQERVWAVGVAHLVDIPEIREFSDEEVKLVIDLAQELADFPSGPVGYLPGGADRTTEEDYRLITLTHPGAPHLQMKIGLGIAGFVAVGLNRSGHFGGGENLPSGVLLSDVESVMADVFTLSMTAAIQMGYFGPIDMAFAISPEGPGATPAFYALDGATGEPALTRTFDTPLPVVPHRTELSVEVTAESVLADLSELATRFAHMVGSAPQLVDNRYAVELADDADPIRIAHERKAAQA